MRINNNITAMNSHRQYGVNNGKISKSVEKLSSGQRINRAGDDAAGLAISEKMRAQIRGLNMASKNSQDAISLIQTAEGAMQTAHDVMQRMRELAVQAASDTNDNSVDRLALNQEYTALNTELGKLGTEVKFNGKLLFGQSGFVIQSGANTADTISVAIGSIGAPSQTTILNQTDASTAIGACSTAINNLSTERSKLGALQNRLEFKVQSLDISAENLSAAESRIRDVDMAKEMTNFTKNNILYQASTAMLAQANSLPQGVLQLLG